MLRTLLILAIPAAGLMANLVDPTGPRHRGEPLRLEAVPITQSLRPVQERLLARCREAAATGDAEAQFRLGLMYYFGDGVPMDWSEARTWLRKASEQGRADAQAKLGAMCFLGEGGPCSLAESLRWFRCAAEQGQTLAQTGLGIMYAFGLGVPQDLLRAYVWLRQGEAGGNAEAAWLCREVMRCLTPAQVEEGNRLAAEAIRRR